MSERDELATLILGKTAPRAADAILAAGYRKPPTIDNDKLVIDDGTLLLEVGSCTCTPYGSSHEVFCGYEYLDDLTGPLERAGYRKLTIDAATVERAAEALRGVRIGDKSGRMYAARAVLSAAVQEER